MGTNLTSDVIVTRGLTKKRDSFALDHVDVSIPTGFITGMVGPNGAGKTTLIKILLGLIRADAGEATLFGNEPAGSPAARGRIGVVLDRVTAAAEWRVASVGRRIGGLYPQWDEPLYQDLLRRFGVPTNNRVDALSRGQSVKLSLAMALAHHPELLLLDEPSSGLDPVARRELADVIREFMLDPSHTVVFSTHITAELDDLADHILVLNGGTVAYAGLLHELHDEFAVARGSGPLSEAMERLMIGVKRESAGGYEALIHSDDTAQFGPETVIDAATTDDVVVHFAAQTASTRKDSHA